MSKEKQTKDQIKSKGSGFLFLRRPPAFFDPIRKLFEPPQRLIEPYIKRGQVVADLGCGSGYYTIALADLVGPEGEVHAVDLDEKCIRRLEKRAVTAGFGNVKVQASSAADLSFIKDKSVDFIFAIGLL